MGFTVSRVVSLLSPVLSLGVFWWLPFNPAVTLYVLINGLAFVLLKVLELRRLDIELDEIVHRHTSHKVQ